MNTSTARMLLIMAKMILLSTAAATRAGEPPEGLAAIDTGAEPPEPLETPTEPFTAVREGALGTSRGSLGENPLGRRYTRKYCNYV